MQTLTEKQLEILDISTKLFAENGYKETSVRDIANSLKVRAASLYTHIESKDQLLEWICDDVLNRFYKIANEVNESEASGMEKLFQYTVRYVEEQRVSLDRFSIFINYHYLIDPQHNYKYTIAKQKNVEFVSELLKAEYVEKEDDIFIPDSSAFLYVRILRQLPTWIKKDTTDLEMVAKVVMARFFYGFYFNEKNDEKK